MKTNILSKLGKSVPTFLLVDVLMFSPIMPIQLVSDEITGPALIFNDISETDYDGYDKYRAAALSDLGIISGKGDTKFDPYASITRQGVAAEK